MKQHIIIENGKVKGFEKRHEDFETLEEWGEALIRSAKLGMYATGISHIYKLTTLNLPPQNAFVWYGVRDGYDLEAAIPVSHITSLFTPLELTEWKVFELGKCEPVDYGCYEILEQKLCYSQTVVLVPWYLDNDNNMTETPSCWFFGKAKKKLQPGDLFRPATEWSVG